MKVKTTVDYVELEGERGPVDGVQVTCDRCGHCEESFGTSDSSLKRCAFLLRENCPNGEDNYYQVEE